MDDAQAQQTNPLFGIIPKEFFTPLASPNRLVYWDCLCRLFQAMSAQLSFGIESSLQSLFAAQRMTGREGDQFICDKEVKDKLVENFHPLCTEMEKNL